MKVVLVVAVVLLPLVVAAYGGYLYGLAVKTPERALARRLHELERQKVNALMIDDTLEMRAIDRKMDVVRATLRDIQDETP